MRVGQCARRAHGLGAGVQVNGSTDSDCFKLLMDIKKLIQFSDPTARAAKGLRNFERACAQPGLALWSPGRSIANDGAAAVAVAAAAPAAAAATHAVLRAATVREARRLRESSGEL
jgi:hypothetical protein